VLLFALTLVLSQVAKAQVFSVLHAFTGGIDGAFPTAGLTIDQAGKLYGTSANGGHTGGNCPARGCGTVFRLSNTGVLTTLYTFQGGNDGAIPLARVIFGRDGSLYGTTSEGGGSGWGTVFKLNPPATFCRTVLCPWTETVLYRFTGGSDGAGPGPGDITFDQAGNLYGTTEGGGIYNCGGNPCGTVYKLTKSTGWTESVLHSFAGPPDGDTPESGVIFDTAGKLYGTTAFGGNSKIMFGTVYELSPSGGGWRETILTTFSDGGLDVPIGGLIIDPLGNLYGTGSQSDDGECCGGVFEFTPSGGNWIYSILYLFTTYSPAAAGGPFASLTMDTAGNLYGTTYGTGPYMYSYGTVFKLIQSGGQWNETDLYAFTDGDDGSSPQSNVVFDTSGNLYGTASQGGAYSHGVVWEITP
jgi:uncharacterized repeat protein (TIGR03803 family)